MKITSPVFQAYLECPTKCFLRAHGGEGTGNEYADWVRTENQSYRRRETECLANGITSDECIRGLINATALKAAKCKMALNVVASTDNQESEIHAVETVPSGGRGKAALFIPVRFIFRNKLTTNDKLLLAFDAFVLSATLGRPVGLGKIIHGDDHSTLKVKTASMRSRVGKAIAKITTLLAVDKAPDLMLNRHCGECEYQTRCKQKAAEKDDLSLLSGMPEKEREKLNGKGIFTVKQLSYTFRPRHRPKRLRGKKEKYHYSLKALAIREKKIHIVGTPVPKFGGTPVYLDVEGLPDQDFYYLIGVRAGEGDSAVQHSLWADSTECEKNIWESFLNIMDGIAHPVLIHYGSYETIFLKRMGERYGKPPAGSDVSGAIETPVNILSIMYAQVYFPTYGNGLKEVAKSLGYRWSEAEPSGAKTVMWRLHWEQSADQVLKQKIICYNAEDCQALECVTKALVQVCTPMEADSTMLCALPAAHVDSMPRETMWPQFASPISALEDVNRAARWDYQRNRIYLKADRQILAKVRHKVIGKSESTRVNKWVEYLGCANCPQCGHRCIQTKRAQRVLYDLKFTQSGLKRWVVRYEYPVYWCRKCRQTFGAPSAFLAGSKYGRDLTVYVAYCAVDLCMPLRTICQSVNKLFGFRLTECSVVHFKVRCASMFTRTRDAILRQMISGPLILADETQICIKGKRTYVWVFTSLHAVVYLHNETREGEMLHHVLSGFKGILVSDFYTAYDSIDCVQQKCLLHLTRDLNDELLAQPYDEELRCLVKEFADLLRPMIETIDRHGLKKYFLKRHRVFVDRFYRKLGKSKVTSEAAKKCMVRLEKNREKLFVFLEHDGVPWNNNSAEHAIKAFARLRRVIEGLSTASGIESYLILLSVCQTCKYRGVDFLDFVRSGAVDIDTFAEARRKKKHNTMC